MSMNTYPIYIKGLYVDTELASYILASLEKKDNALPESVAKAIADGTFVELAKAGHLYDLADLTAAFDYVLDELPNGGTISEFDGGITTLIPDKAIKPIEESYSDEYICYVALQKKESIFKQAYESPEECLEELQEVFEDAGIDIPEEFDWWAHFVTFVGTNFC